MEVKLRYKFFEKVKRIVLREFPKLSYARSGEDLLLDEIFEYKSQGLFIDVGAFHPIKYSNTFKFYLKGWRGVNIEPNKDLIQNFKIIRKEDINLNIAISSVPGIIKYYVNGADSSMNTVSEGFAKKANQDYGFETSEIRNVEAKRLSDVLTEINLGDKNIDFLNVDVEGHDFEVLKSNDWNLYRPRVVLVELNCSINNITESDIYMYMILNRYCLISYIFLNHKVGNAFFINND